MTVYFMEKAMDWLKGFVATKVPNATWITS